MAVVSDVFAETLFPGQEAIGQAFQLTYGTKVYTFYIVGVYPYESNGLVLESIDATPTTDMYLPISTAKAMSHADDGYQSFTVVAATGVDTSAFLTQTENFFAGYYTRNTSYTATASSMESLMAVSYTHLDVYKRQVRGRTICRWSSCRSWYWSGRASISLGI